MKKIFVISWFFPPINSSEGVLAFKALSHSTHQFIVYTQSKNNNWSYGANEKQLVSDNIEVIEGNPNTFDEWIAEGLNYFRANSHQFSAMMSRSMPVASHLLALKIKEEYPNLKWVSSFGDPIDNSPYLELLIQNESPFRLSNRPLYMESLKEVLSIKRNLNNFFWEKSNKKRIRKIKNEHFVGVEEKVFNQSDLVIVNNIYQKKFMLASKRTDESKVRVFPHCFDLNYYEEVQSRQFSEDKIVITHLGHLDNYRSPNILFEAISRLIERHQDCAKKLEFHFYGNMSDKDKVFIVDNNLGNYIYYHKPVSYFKSLEIMKSSDVLLLIDANIGKVTKENIYFAGKLADYIGANKPIVAITNMDGPSSDIVNEIGGTVCSFSVADIYQAIYLLTKGTISGLNSNVVNYDIKNNVQYLDCIFKELIEI